MLNSQPRATAHEINRHIVPRLHLTGDKDTKVAYLSKMMTEGHHNIAPVRWGMDAHELDSAFDAFSHHHETAQHFTHSELQQTRRIFHEKFGPGTRR